MELGYNSMKPQELKVAVTLVEGRHICRSPRIVEKNRSHYTVALDKHLKKERGYSIVVIVSPCVTIS